MSLKGFGRNRPWHNRSTILEFARRVLGIADVPSEIRDSNRAGSTYAGSPCLTKIRITKFRSYELHNEAHTVGLDCQPKSFLNRNERLRMQRHPVSSPHALLWCASIILLLSFKGKRYSCNRPWRPMGLWGVAPTFSRQSAHRWRWDCQPYAPTALYPQEDSRYSFLLQAESTPGPYCGWKD
jgi:hypothetical protein